MVAGNRCQSLSSTCRQVDGRRPSGVDHKGGANVGRRRYPSIQAFDDPGAPNFPNVKDMTGTAFVATAFIKLVEDADLAIKMAITV